MPDSLPLILFYRVGRTVRPTLCRREVQSVGTSGCTGAAQVCPRIPLGADAWRLSGETAWRSLDTLPAEWMPYLMRG